VPRSKGRALAIAGIALSAVLLTWIVLWAARQEAPTLPSSAGAITALLGAIGLYALNTCLRGERWHRLLAARGERPTRTDTYALTVVGFLGNNTLPARLGDVLRVALLPAARSRREVAGTLVAERILDVLVLVVLFLVVAVGVLHAAVVPDLWAGIALVAGALALAAGAVALLWWRRRELVLRAAVFLRPVANATLQLRGGYGAAMLLGTVVIWVVEAGVWWASAEAAGLHIDAIEALYLVSLACMASMIPSGPGYAGTQDAAALIGARAVGASNQVALSFLVIVRFVLLVPITITGFILLLTRYGGVRMLRQALGRTVVKA
jgi:uncharacterized membrane protein YbhN (UPF0104 family)